MEAIWIELSNYAVEFFNKPSVMETFVDILVCAVPMWVAVMIGLLIGWSWKPKWTGLVFLGFRSKFRFFWTAPPGFGARRFWLALTALSVFSVCRRLWFRFRGQSSSKLDAPGDPASTTVPSLDAVDEATSGEIKAIIGASGGESNNVTEKDLEHFLYLLGRKDGEMPWQSMMDRSTSNLSYKAWSYEPEMGPIVYRSKTVFEDATPDLVNDFFWDDEFRRQWDPMLVYVKILPECPNTGMMISHWIKKFPFFCSDREYIIGRRIWEAEKTYYCLTKKISGVGCYVPDNISYVPNSNPSRRINSERSGFKHSFNLTDLILTVRSAMDEHHWNSILKKCCSGIQYASLPRREKPRRVGLYFSSWAIKPVQSRKGDGQLSACEVTLVHYEDMGIPKDVAKLGVRHGMWGTVKKLHSGFRAYQNARGLDPSPSRCALMARIKTRIPHDEATGNNRDQTSPEGLADTVAAGSEQEQKRGDINWKWLAIGGTIALVCGFRTGLIGKALLVGAGHRVARGRRNPRR